MDGSRFRGRRRRRGLAGGYRGPPPIVQEPAASRMARQQRVGLGAAVPGGGRRPVAESALRHSGRLGADHLDVMSLRFRRASAQRLRGDYAEAEREWQDLLADRLRVRGLDHPDTRITQESLTALERRANAGSDTGR